jgi:uncharacterized HAD superfamily protein
MNFVSLQQLRRDVTEWAKSIPPHDCVCGVEWSGMLPASILASLWGKSAMPLQMACPGNGSLLVVDDSINFGGAMRLARAIAPQNSHFAAVYAANEQIARQMNYHYQILPQPRFFEWNVWKHDLLACACVDMDGIICEDCQTSDNDDGPRYEAFLKNAEPRYLPRITVSAIVTGRLEKYRLQTSRWLSRHGVSYRSLHMMPMSTMQERRSYGIARFKSEIYSGTAYRLFIESADEQAREISNKTKKPVLLVPETGEWSLL